MAGAAYRISKRIFDVVAATAGLLIAAGPMLLIAAAIKLTSRGPVFFVQERAGLGMRPFKLIKFRTMRSGVDPFGHSPTSGEDPRLTTVGRLLRAWGLDELPQLFNVLAGQMSIVGPRPLLMWQARSWSPRQRRRLDVKPGITGLSQVSGRAALTIEDKIELDLRYVERAGFFYDMWILLRTPIALLRGRGVYEQLYSRRQTRNDQEKSR